MVATGLERDAERGTAGGRPGGRERRDLGVRPAEDSVPALTHDRAVGCDHDRPHLRVGLHVPGPAAGELEGATHRGGVGRTARHDGIGSGPHEQGNDNVILVL